MSDTVENNFQNKICLKSQTDYKSIKIMWLGCLVSEKNPKKTGLNTILLVILA